MAEVIQFSDNKYLDAENVYNRTLGKTINELAPNIGAIGKVISYKDSYVLDFFNNAEVTWSPIGANFNIGGPIVGCIYMKHQTAGGCVIVMSYQTPRPIFYHIVDGVIQDEYCL